MSLLPGPQGGPYLGGFPGQLERDPLADLGGQLVQHVSLEATNHHLAEAAMQLVQVGGTTAVPLPPSTKVPAKKEARMRVRVGGGFLHLQRRPPGETICSTSSVLFFNSPTALLVWDNFCKRGYFCLMISNSRFSPPPPSLSLPTPQKSPACNFHKSSAKLIFFFF